MELSTLDATKFFLTFSGSLNIINSLRQLKTKYDKFRKEYNNQNGNISSDGNKINNFLIISEFNKLSNSMFTINNPILSYELHKEIKDISCLGCLWKISKKEEGNLLKIGDIIKLGRIRLKIDAIKIGDFFESSIKNTYQNKNNSRLIKQIKTSLSPSISRNNSIIDEENFLNEKKANEKIICDNKNSIISGKPMCRICYLTNSDIDNPLISPCNCSGSMGCIHFNCLKKCIEMNVKKKIDQYYKFYYWKKFDCEICKAEYPKYIKYKDRYYHLISLDINFSSYIICDYWVFDDMKKKNYRRGILIINLKDDKDDEITIGRSQNNKIKLRDISVSRFHCSLIKKNKTISIIDKCSKFGSLIYVNSPLMLSTNFNNENTFISGRYYFLITFIERKSFMEKLFPIKCCECKAVKGNTDVDIEKLGKEEKRKNNNIKNLDKSYEDIVINLGDFIYLHKGSINNLENDYN